MAYSDIDRVLALAGLLQATELVEHIAHHGQIDQASLETCIQSIFTIDSESVEQIYGHVAKLELGLKILVQQLSGGSQRNSNITRYTLQLLLLERRLVKQPKILTKLRHGIEDISQEKEHLRSLNPTILSALADLYTETISKLGPKILVHGDQSYLTRPDNVIKIRALFLAAIRSAVLWQQCGGSRFKLLLFNRSILETAKQLII